MAEDPLGVTLVTWEPMWLLWVPEAVTPSLGGRGKCLVKSSACDGASCGTYVTTLQLYPESQSLAWERGQQERTGETEGGRERQCQRTTSFSSPHHALFLLSGDTLPLSITQMKHLFFFQGNFFSLQLYFIFVPSKLF